MPSELPFLDDTPSKKWGLQNSCWLEDNEESRAAVPCNIFWVHNERAAPWQPYGVPQLAHVHSNGGM